VQLLNTACKHQENISWIDNTAVLTAVRWNDSLVMRALD